jgi:AraC-like DNA-binding protein
MRTPPMEQQPKAPSTRRVGVRRTSRSNISAGTLSNVAVHLVMQVGIAAGLRREVLLAAADITEKDLSDPDARFPIATTIAMWEALARRVSDPAFGVSAGGALRIRQLGLLGYVASFSATLRDALCRWARYGRVFSEAMQVNLDDGPRGTIFTVQSLAPGPQHWLQQDVMVAAWLQVSRELTGVDLVPVEVSFTHAQPPSTLVHRQHFRCPLQFEAREARIVFRRSDLDLPIAKADDELAGYLSKYAEQVLASLVRGDTWKHTVRAAIWALLADGKPTLARVASALGVPRRTLQRRLAAEGTSLHRETEEIRKTMAVAVLRDPSLSIADVSFLLGYAEPSAFFRSFRRWTGKTPRAFRRVAA